MKIMSLIKCLYREKGSRQKPYGWGTCPMSTMCLCVCVQLLVFNCLGMCVVNGVIKHISIYIYTCICTYIIYTIIIHTHHISYMFFVHMHVYICIRVFRFYGLTYTACATRYCHAMLCHVMKCDVCIIYSHSSGFSE